jgi:hypothetical protein
MKRAVRARGSEGKNMRLATLGTILLLITACGNDDGDDGPSHGGSSGSSTGGSGGGGAAGATATGGSSSGGTAGGGGSNGGSSGVAGSGSNGWMRPTSCGDLGKVCSEGCVEPTICYAYEPAVCVPRSESGGTLRCSIGSCSSPDEPYCIHDFCMTYEEAACFCTTEPGSAVNGCTVGPDAHPQ